MSDGLLPKGLTLIEEENEPALPAGLTLLGDSVETEPKPKAEKPKKQPVEEAPAPIEDDEDDTGFFGADKGLLSKDSDFGRLSPEQQDKWIKKTLSRSRRDIKRAEKKIAHFKAERDKWAKYKHPTIGASKARDGLIINQARLKRAKAKQKAASDVFEGRIPAPEFGPIRNKVASGVQGATRGFVESTPKFLGGVQASITGQEPTETALYQYGQRKGEKLDHQIYVDPARQAETGQQVAGGVGQAASFMVPGSALKAIGAGPKLAAGATYGSGMMQQGAQGLDDAIALGGDTKQQLISLYSNSALGITEALPINRLFGRLNRTTGGQIDRIVKNSTASGTEELMQEIGQTIGSNVIAAELAGYDEGRSYLEGAGEAGKVGGLVGMLLGGGGAVMTRPNTDAQTPLETPQTPINTDVQTDAQPEGNQDIEPAAPIRSVRIKKSAAFDTQNGRTEVEYAIVELGDLITSHGDTMEPNPAYPQALQPRDRSRKSSETQVQDIFAKFQPERMGETAEAGSGSPIISENGVVESGNGRTMGLRRVYQENGEKAQSYRDWLDQNGYDTQDFNQPVLVRIADPSRTDAERVAFTRRANAPTTADMSVTERGIADAKALSPQDFDLAKSGEITQANNTPFVRQVLTKVTTEAERGKLIDGNGKLSVDGKRRVEAAVASYAYEDGRVLSDLIETTDGTLRGIGEAMIGAAPKWAGLRADIEAGRVDERTNIVPQIIEAANIVADARSTGSTVAERVEAIKTDMFNTSGEVDAVTQDILKIFYDEQTLKQRTPKAIAEDLNYYAQEAAKVQAGPDMFGDSANDNPAKRILEATLNRQKDKAQKTVDEDVTTGAKGEQVFLPEGLTEITDDKPKRRTQPKVRTKPDTSYIVERLGEDGEWDFADDIPAEGVRKAIAERKAQGDKVRVRKVEKTPVREDADGKPLFDKAPKTESAAFKRWFGDSKVVDDNGAPLVVYHGTDADIDAFKSELLGSVTSAASARMGFFFTDSEKTAKTYANNAYDKNTDKIAEKSVELDDAGDQDGLDKLDAEIQARYGVFNDGNGGNVMETYISLQNPKTIDADGADMGEWRNRLPEEIQKAQSEGHDGVVIKNFSDTADYSVYDAATHYIAFNPNQIKSVENKGTFDPNDDRILYDRAPAVTELKDDVTPAKPKPKQMTRGRQERVSVETNAGEKVGYDGETKGLHEITNAIRKRFGAIARQGRMGNLPQSVRGFFKPRTGVIRTRQSYLAEIDTFAHEVGHHFEYMNDSKLRDIMEIHRSELGPMDYEPGRKDKKVQLSEGFAEFFTAYITNQKYSSARAPKFTKRFEAWMKETHPGLKEDIAEFHKQYQAWLKAPSATSIAANIVQHPKTAGFDKHKERAADQGKRSYAGTVLNHGIEKFVDRLNPMKLVVKRLESLYRENTGNDMKLKASQDPYKILRLGENAANKGVMAMYDGVVPYREAEAQGASLQGAIMTAIGGKKKWTKENVTDFDAYLVARRAVQEYKRYYKGEIKNPPTINSLEDHKMAVEDFENANPQFADAAKQVHEYISNLWRKKFDAGLITEELFNETQKREDYVPFRRDMSDKAATKKFMAGFGKDGKHAGGTHHFDGSNRPILSPLQSIMEDSITTERTITQNDAMRALVNMTKRAGRGSAAVAEVLPAKQIKGTKVDVIEAMTNRMRDSSLSPEDQQLIIAELSDLWDGDGMTSIFRMVDANEKGENIVYVWEDGKRKPVKVGDPELAMDIHSMMLGVNEESKALLIDILSVPTTALRMGITNHPMFIATNFTRDQLSTWIQTDAGFVPFLDGFKGVVSEVTNDKYAKAYNTMGGVSGGVNVSAFKRNVIEKDLKRLQNRGIRARRLWRLSEMSKLGDVSESSTRLGVFARYVKKFKKQGMSDYDAFFEAAFEAQDVMDFGMHGTQMQSARRLIPFLNAQIVGLYKSGRVLAPGGLFKTVMPYLKHRMGGDSQNLTQKEIRNIERGAKAWAKVSFIGLIGLAISAIHDDDEEYLEFNDYYRATHWVTKINGEWVLIPKPFELAAMSNLFERSYEAFKLKDEDAFKKFRKGLREMLTPPMNVPAIGIPIEQSMNKTFFKKAPIVPRGTEALPEYLQYSANTSVMSRKLGGMLNWSPARIDHVIKALGGTMGRDLLRTTDAVSGEKPSLSASNTPVASRLVKDPNYSSESITKMFDLVGQTDGKWTGQARALASYIEDEDATGAQRILKMAEKSEGTTYVIAGALYKKKIKYRRQHPMKRAAEASQVLRKARREIATNEFAEIDLTRDQRRDLSDLFAKLDVTMSRNGLKHSGVKGWKQKHHTPEQPILDEIEKVSPKAHKALTAAFKKKKMTAEDNIQREYDSLKARLARDVKKYDGLAK